MSRLFFTFIVLFFTTSLFSDSLTVTPLSNQDTSTLNPSSDNEPSFVSHISSAKEALLGKAREFLGVRYGFGSQTSSRTDCSGFTEQVFKTFGVCLPHSAAEQAQLGERVDFKNLQAGDLLFYRTYKHAPSHVAIYVGNGKMIHASYRSRKVQYDSVNLGYYQKRFLCAKRIALANTDALKNYN